MSNAYIVDPKQMTIMGFMMTNSINDSNPDHVVVKSKDDLSTFSADQLVQLHNNYADQPVNMTEDGENAVMDLTERMWSTMENLGNGFINFNPVEAVNHEKAVKRGKKGRKHRDSKFLKLIAAFKEGGTKTIQELCEATGYTEQSVIVRISVLRSDKHEYKMNIVKDRDSKSWTLFNDDGTEYVPSATTVPADIEQAEAA